MTTGTHFTHEQAAAIRVPLDTDACVVAPAGSGKTTTAAGRVAYLLLRSGLAPRNIVAVTYTDSAAATLKQRVAALVRERCGTDLLGLCELQVGTFHAVAQDWLRRFLPRFSQHRVLPEAQRRLLVGGNFDRIGVGRVERREGNGKRATTRFLTENPNDSRLFLDACDLIRAECLDLSRLPTGLRAAYEGYLKLLDEKRRIDFAQILAEVRAALNDAEKPECLLLQEYVATTLGQILVDEYQDVAPLLVRILHRLHTLGARFWVVGDPRQAVMGFNGGDPRSLTDFGRRFTGAAYFPLTRNFRSSPQILDAAEAFLPQMGVTTLIDHDRSGAVMRAAGHHVSERGDMAALVLPTVDAQDAWGAERLKAMHGTPFVDKIGTAPRGLRWSDMAVLVRRREAARRVAASLRAAGIPVYLHGAEHLLESDEADAVATLFEYLAERASGDAVRAALRKADLGIPDEKISRGLAHLDAVRAAAEAEPIAPVCLIGTLYESLGEMGFEERRVPKAKANAKDSGGYERRELVMHNVARVARAAQDYQAVNHLLGPPSRKFAEFAIWLRTQAPQDYAEGGGGTGGEGDVIGGVVPDAVHILTLHKAKATEYPVVWMADVSEGELPIKSWPGRSRVWSVLPRHLVPAPSRFDGTHEEEVRLFFVGLTRAMRYLFVTAPAALPKGNKVLPPSPLLRWLQSHPAFVTDPNLAPPTTSDPKLPARQPRWRDRENDGEAEAAITQTPSELGVFFACPYQWKLRVGFAFPPPAVETLGHPDAIHSAIREFHDRELRGELPLVSNLPDAALDALAEELIARHHHAPFATASLLPHLRAAALRKIKAYIRDYEARAASAGEKVDAVEQPIGAMIEGVNVVGRYDMSSKDAAGRAILDDMKTSRAAAGRDPDLLIPRIYGLGREALTGELPALVRHRVVGASAEHDRVLEMDEVIAEDTRVRIADAARAITMNVLPARPAEGRRTCQKCDPAALCFKGCGLKKQKVGAIQKNRGWSELS